MEIWESGVKMGLDKKLGSIGKTPWQNIGALLYTDIKNEDSLFCITSRQPTTFYLKNKAIPTQSFQVQRKYKRTIPPPTFSKILV